MVHVIHVKGAVDGCWDGSRRINVSRELYAELKSKGLIHKRFDEGYDRWVYTIIPRECVAAGYQVRFPDGKVMGASKIAGKYVYSPDDFATKGKYRYFDSIGELEAYIASGADQEA